MITGQGGKNGEFLSVNEVEELFEVLRALGEKSEQQSRQIDALEEMLEKAQRGRWVDWTASAVIGLTVTILAKLLGLPA